MRNAVIEANHNRKALAPPLFFDVVPVEWREAFVLKAFSEQRLSGNGQPITVGRTASSQALAAL
jgi:hypothetical protein